MHIVLDTRIIETSTGRYMQRLLENLHDHHADDGNGYTALVPSKHVDKWQMRLPNFDVVAADQKWYTLAEQWSLYRQLRALKPDLVHFTMPQQPFLYTGPAVTTIHDMTLIRHENIDDMNPLVYRFKKFVFLTLVRVVLRRATQIITPTEFVRQDLGVFFGKTYLKKITVTYEAGEIPTVSPEPLKKFVGKEYFCFVGNAFPYKNVKRIILAHQKLIATHPDTHLLLAGKKDFFYEELEQFVKNESIPNIHFLGFISDGEKRWMLQNAVGFVTASQSEGFCIPLLEAMYEDCPVLASNASCIPEVAGDAALYFNPNSTNELAKLMKRLLEKRNVRTALIEKGRKRVKDFSWRKMAEQTHSVYTRILES